MDKKAYLDLLQDNIDIMRLLIKRQTGEVTAELCLEQIFYILTEVARAENSE